MRIRITRNVGPFAKPASAGTPTGFPTFGRCRESSSGALSSAVPAAHPTVPTTASLAAVREVIDERETDRPDKSRLSWIHPFGAVFAFADSRRWMRAGEGYAPNGGGSLASLRTRASTR